MSIRCPTIEYKDPMTLNLVVHILHGTNDLLTLVMRIPLSPDDAIVP